MNDALDDTGVAYDFCSWLDDEEVWKMVEALGPLLPLLSPAPPQAQAWAVPTVTGGGAGHCT